MRVISFMMNSSISNASFKVKKWTTVTAKKKIKKRFQVSLIQDFKQFFYKRLLIAHWYRILIKIQKLMLIYKILHWILKKFPRTEKRFQKLNQSLYLKQNCRNKNDNLKRNLFLINIQRVTRKFQLDSNVHTAHKFLQNPKVLEVILQEPIPAWVRFTK